ncbi:hypothetical protein BPOR_0660g00010 [Botrytis porri]|uniref:Uncharacterized protein n=1 Tax=Botrytis porri TaxID=87229 RepID=A0A4Z1KDC3_9HELO|nr:hypothetical protein BPOR_0660g00010 [Botrytis porri]
MSANEDLEISGTKPDWILKRTDILYSAIDNFGLNSVQTLPACMVDMGKSDSKTTETADDKKGFNITVAGERVTVVTNGGDSGLFEWFPTEIKKYAFQAPRIVLASFKQVKRNSSCGGHFRPIYSGPRISQLFINRLTRQQAIRKYGCLYNKSVCTSGSIEIPKINYNAANDTVWLRETEFWSGSSRIRFPLIVLGKKWRVRRLVIDSSSRKALIEMENLNRLSVVLASHFSRLRQLIVIVDHLDLTTPG